MINIETILNKINVIINNISQKKKEKIIYSETMFIIGEKSPFDSNDLVEICLALEDISVKDNFNFDWTSEKAMSDFNSIFKNPKSLAEEYLRQYKLIK